MCECLCLSVCVCFYLSVLSVLDRDQCRFIIMAINLPTQLVSFSICKRSIIFQLDELLCQGNVVGSFVGKKINQSFTLDDSEDFCNISIYGLGLAVSIHLKRV